MDDVVEYNHIATGIDGIRGNGYGIYNAMTGYFQNMKNFRSDEQNIKSIDLGGLSAQ